MEADLIPDPDVNDPDLIKKNTVQCIDEGEQSTDERKHNTDEGKHT